MRIYISFKTREEEVASELSNDFLVVDRFTNDWSVAEVMQFPNEDALDDM